MNGYAMKKMVRRCVKVPQLANLDGFLLVALDLESISLGAGGAFVWRREDRSWSCKILEGTSRTAIVKEPAEVAADFRLLFFDRGADVRFFAHVNRTGDGLNIKEDRVSIDRGRGPQEFPIVYWNAGSIPVKADGRRIRPGHCFVLSPSDPARVKRRKMGYQMKQWLLEQYNSQIKQVEEEIMILRPDCPEPLVHCLAVQFCNQYMSA